MLPDTYERKMGPSRTRLNEDEEAAAAEPWAGLGVYKEFTHTPPKQTGRREGRWWCDVITQALYKVVRMI